MKCPKCRAYNPDNATECSECAVLFRDLGSAKREERTKFTGHDSNPNDPVCQSCGGVASIYPGVLRGGGRGYCSDCFRRIGHGAFMGKSEHGSQTLRDLREMLAHTESALEQRRSRRQPGEDEEEVAA